MESTILKKNLNRITWIDIAKGVTIILVIIGHTVEFNSFVRNFIFSFHMPLFFILSGYTYKVASDWSTFVIHLKKNFKSLIIPSLIICCITILIKWIGGGTGDGSLETLWNISKRMGDSIWWASGGNVRSHEAIVMLWFLFSLFWGKLFIDIIYILFPGKNVGYIYIFVGLLGILLGIKGKWLPQNLDVTFVAMIFIYMGMLWKRYTVNINKYKNILFFISIIFWISCLNFNIYIEMAIRSYPFYIVSIVEAILGSFAICCLCEALVSNKKITKVIQFIGMHSLIILLIHQIDWCVVSIWWQTHSLLLSCIIRTVLVLSVAFIIYIFNKHILEKIRL